MARTAVVALGGNALAGEGQQGTYGDQRANATAMATPICAMLDAGWRVVVVHGNGPQVGNLAIQQEMGRGQVPEMPLFSLGAMTEGQLGSLIAIALYGVCGRRHRVAALLSHVIVDLDDPAFDRPTKPIGPFFSEVAARRLAETQGWDIIEDSGRGFRRVVASPEPKSFVEIDAIGCLLDAGHVVVTGGGGGIPVGRREGGWDGVDAVIDKDYAAAELAHQLGAEALVLITGVDAVQLDFGKGTQRRLTWLDSAEAERHLAAGQFPAGSMGPKVRAAIQFVRRGGRVAVITSHQLVVDTLGSADPTDQSVGTRIIHEDSRQGAIA
ncbi:carbamate kinase [Nocardioides guangzhouensis]|uniref:Carbamate kinase n=1 Tax=Nocardioides guangzhouensis TaxID=2497878 RepID=A0A4Q4ZB49_9ACTN|nr:carbamate kinase [Nocardioides guangzhouensis]RYP84466.1 carbamate kinase [Nocardioides guangzhouensis]